jgi:hypothetical protein
LSQMGSAYSPATDKLIISAGDRAPSCCDYTNDTFVLEAATRACYWSDR